MTFEDFTYELAELRDLARARGRERIGILRLLMAGMGDCEFPETRQAIIVKGLNRPTRRP